MLNSNSILDILIINDKQSYSDAVARDLIKLNCTADSVVHLHAKQIFDETLDKLVSQNKSYDGVILDIMFSDEPFGGIDLWKELYKKNVTESLGGLMVLSNTDQQQTVIDYFKSISKQILLLSGSPASGKRRLEDLTLFTNLLRGK